jgi:N-acetylglucosaminyl-diphospho-decaprenol L-rhamnosyltransferase
MDSNTSAGSISDRSSAEQAVSVSVVIVSYRTAELVVRSLAALEDERENQRANGIAVRAIVVDNASGDAEPIRQAILREGWNGWVDLIVSDTNGGFAYGNNLGFRHACESGERPDFFFLLNPDAQVRPNAIGALVEFLKGDPKVACASSSLEGPDGALWPYAFRFPNIVGEIVAALGVGVLERFLRSWVVLRRMDDHPAEVDWFPGAAMMVRTAVLEQIGGMDQAYFLYYEETDFCLKVRRHGFTNWYVPASRVMHIAGQSTGVTGEKAVAQRLPGYWFESRRRYYLKNFGVPYAMATDVLAIVAHALGIAKGRIRRRPGKTQPHLIGDLWQNSTLFEANRAIAPASEYRPPPSRSADRDRAQTRG